MGTPPLARAGDHRILAWTALLVGLALVGSLALVPAASSATVTSAWQAKIGAKGANGTAKLQVYDTGTGSLTLRLMKMRPATLLPVVLHKGTCRAVGPVLARLDAVRSSNAGVANRTSSLTVTRVRAILAATRSGKLAIRVGSGSALRCGVFAALALPTPTASPEASPVATASATPSPSGGGTLFVGSYFMIVAPPGWTVRPISYFGDVELKGPGHRAIIAHSLPRSGTLEDLVAEVTAQLGQMPGPGLEGNEAITLDGTPARLLTYHWLIGSQGFHVLDAISIHNGRGYEIQFQNWPGDESADRLLFLEVLASFAFMSAG
jgi:hypothetical protein